MLLVVIFVLALLGLSRFFLMRYTPDPRFANGATAAVFAAFLVGLYSARALLPVAPAPPAAAPALGSVLGTGTPPGLRDTSGLCRSVNGSFGAAAPGSIDDLRSDEQQTSVVAEGGQVNARVQYVAEGWATESGMDRPAAGVCLVVDGKIEPRARSYFGLARPDIAAGYHHAEVGSSGYMLVIAPGTLSPGKHRIQAMSKLGSGFATLPAVRNVFVH